MSGASDTEFSTAVLNKVLSWLTAVGPDSEDLRVDFLAKVASVLSVKSRVKEDHRECVSPQSVTCGDSTNP